MIGRLLIITLTLLVAACSKREEADPEALRERDHELATFSDAIRIVQERYVDVDQVEMTRIISNSLKGVVESVDPYATIYFSRHAATPGTPDTPSLNIDGPDHDGLLVLKVFRFDESLTRELKRAKRELKHASISGILIDGRGSTGDDYEDAAHFADWFLPRGARIGSLELEQGDRVIEFESRQPALFVSNTVVVVQDNTLSGPGEFLAAALRANERCVLVGQPSRGMAVVQEPIPLTDEWTVMLSTGRANEPGGRAISGSPIVPDIVAQPEPGREDEDVDWSFQRALTVLKDQAKF